MSILTVASKANHALLLPALLTAALINKTDDKGQHVSLVFEDAESINGSEGYIQLKSHDGTTTVYDHAALVYLHDSCGTLQLGNKDLVRAHPSLAALGSPLNFDLGCGMGLPFHSSNGPGL
jgi:hypothetical protein